jgi:tetratricopeptide (TPR) repeat protein
MGFNQDQQPAEPARARLLRWAPLWIVLAGLLAYGNSLGGAWLLDDTPAICQNPDIRRLWPPWAPLQPQNRFMAFYTRPFLNYTMTLDHGLWGLNPRGYHATNLVLHLLAGLALYGLIRRTLRRLSEWRPAADGLALLATLMWVVHPLNSAALNYVCQRGELLVGLFFLLMLYALNRAADGGRKAAAWLALSVLACLLGMGSKEAMLAAPVLALAYDRLFLSATWSELWRRRGGYYVALGLTWLWPASRILVYSPHLTKEAFGPGVMRGYLLTQCWAVARMLKLCVWPAPLIFYYGTGLIRSVGQVWMEAGLLLLLAGATAWGMWRRRPAAFLGLCFFGLLAPSSTLVPIVGQPVAEHRLYAASAAVLVLLVTGAYAYWDLHKTNERTRKQWAFLGGGLLIVMVLGAVTHQRNNLYRDPIRVWEDTLVKQPRNARAHNNLGVLLEESGRPDEALAHYEQALQLGRDYAEAHNNIGVVLAKRGQCAEAARHFNEALRIKPDYVQARRNLEQLQMEPALPGPTSFAAPP